MKPLDTQNMDEQMWLVKVPEYLYGVIERMEDGSEIGEISLSPSNTEMMEVSLSPDVGVSVPKSYHIEMLNTKDNIFIFNNKTNNINIIGRIEEECLLKPEINSEYLELIKEREKYNNNNKRITKSIEEIKDIKFINHKFNKNTYSRKERKLIIEERKRTRLPRENVQDMLFSAFEKKEFWSLQSLTEFCNQPATFIKDILEEIADFYTRGKNKNLFGLKKGFK
eukprot:GHVP01068587.1.p2 GENE.GHVP01068587.1~~GHVP01068587.1.p2  ORF type:complete len:224 (+),score=45.78 GHVP01068587.1:270-941(+)